MQLEAGRIARDSDRINRYKAATQIKSIHFRHVIFWIGLLVAISYALLEYDQYPGKEKVAFPLFIGTIASISFLVITAIYSFFKTLNVKLTPLLLLIPLFIFLHSTTYHAFGADNYIFKTEPDVKSWSIFVMSHMLRIVDVLDIIEETGINIQNIQQKSALSSASLVAMHWIISVVFFFALYLAYKNHKELLALIAQTIKSVITFLLSLVVLYVFQAVLRYAFFGAEALDNRIITLITGFFVMGIYIFVIGLLLLGIIFLLLALMSALLTFDSFRNNHLAPTITVVIISITAYYQGWPLSDLFLWPLDNILRVIDVGDTLQIFHWQMHGVSSGCWNILCALIFRLFVVLYTIKHFNRALIERLNEDQI